MDKIEVFCSHTEMRDPVSLVEHPRNYNTHPAEQIRLLAKIIKHQGWRNPITVSKRSGYVVKGHGRLAAAMLLKCEEVPIDLQDYKDEASELADMIADNRIAELAEADQDALKGLLLDEAFNDFDIELTGFNIEQAAEFEDISAIVDEEKYTKKIEAPIYEPKLKNQPSISELYDDAKTQKLIQEIDDADIGEDSKKFLRLAAFRHCVFNYSMIAEFYAHSSEGTQQLMENSALVVIDLDNAIKNGFVQMSNEIADQCKKDHG